RRRASDEDEVEQLIKAAQDEVLLKLNVDTHMVRPSASIDPDLDRRFHALKKSQKPTSSTARTDDEFDNKRPSGGDALARFAALSMGSNDSINQPETDEGSDDEDDEVERVLRWAFDAARLDPSPPDEFDDRDFGEGNSDDDDDDDDDF
ncbi:hypothetical protein M569_02287, partial [Genlisea aurea]